MIVNIFLRLSLSSRQIIKTHHLTDLAFHWICQELEKDFKQSQFEAGQFVGSLIVQSISSLKSLSQKNQRIF